MKKCLKCEIIKKLDQFYSDKRNADGKRPYCKRCFKILNKPHWDNWCLRNKDKIKTYQHRQRVRRGIKPRIKRDKIDFSISTIGRYGYNLLKELKHTRKWECAWCNSGDDLTIHHKDHNGINNLKRKLPMNNDINNLEIVCRSCHGAMHIIERKWRPKKLAISSKVCYTRFSG